MISLYYNIGRYASGQLKMSLLGQNQVTLSDQIFITPIHIYNINNQEINYMLDSLFRNDF